MIRRFLIATAAALLVLPTASLRAAPTSLMPGSAFGVTWSLLGMELGPWEAYLAHELTPDLPRIQRGLRPEITWLRIDRDVVLPEFAHPLVGDGRNGLALFSTALTEAAPISFAAPSRAARGGVSFQRSMMLSGISSQLSGRNRISVSAVLASQQFSHSMLDTQVFEQVAGVSQGGLRERDISIADGLYAR